MKLWLLLSVVACVPPASSPVPRGPDQLWLWAWERPEDLRFLNDEARVGVAYLAATLVLSGDEVRFLPRRQRLSVPASTPRAAVVRIEVPSGARPELDARQRDRTVARILDVFRDANTDELQLDYDARQSERAFYVELLRQLRGSLPVGARLTMTSLASWCFEDAWFEQTEGLVDAVVPMVFTMGEGGDAIRERLSARPFPQPACRASLGVRLGEPFPPLGAVTSVYAFHHAAWTPSAYSAVRRQIGRFAER